MPWSRESAHRHRQRGRARAEDSQRRSVRVRVRPKHEALEELLRRQRGSGSGRLEQNRVQGDIVHAWTVNAHAADETKMTSSMNLACDRKR